MEALIKMVADKTGISTEQATTAVHTVLGFLKDKLPPGIGSQLESFTGSGTTPNSGGGMGNIGDAISGMFGK